jgi:hypothetical protein
MKRKIIFTTFVLLISLFIIAASFLTWAANVGMYPLIWFDSRVMSVQGYEHPVSKLKTLEGFERINKIGECSVLRYDLPFFEAVLIFREGKNVIRPIEDTILRPKHYKIMAFELFLVFILLIVIYGNYKLYKKLFWPDGINR